MIFLFRNENICCDPSLELTQYDDQVRDHHLIETVFILGHNMFYMEKYG